MFVMVGSKKTKRLMFLMGRLLRDAELMGEMENEIKEIAVILGVASPVKPKAVTHKSSGRCIYAPSYRSGGGCTSAVLAGAA